MAKKTSLETILNKALSEGWIEKDYKDSVLKNHPDMDPATLIKAISTEAGLALTKKIEKELG